ncbi:glycosyl transferase [Gordoniibacillus kamchatkensis]|uniref:Glycosyl transferase n=1 Tax=Gordoniibacillus kamchatkensis TaxID=1590651 RepID=A0ABR5AAM8_9BACL|nr:glycosyltransferase family 4 protein [Paenibacillus sp. VKM B-2647]KIL38115.1 glycosyl transferase [Paenibacillus sp. VKM B-2647]
MVNTSKKRLTIVQVISNRPNALPLPPKNQGGTEKVVYELTEELARRGHRVLLFAAKGSRTSAELITYPKGLKELGIGSFVTQRLPKGTDIIHDHTFSSALGRRKLLVPTLCTFHLPRKRWVKYPVYVSKRARKVMGNNRGFYVYNGINPSEYEFSNKKNNYLLFIGRIIRQKGILHAIRIAEMTKKKLIIAGPIKDEALFRNEIAPRIKNNPNIRYVGAVGGKKKQQLLKHASCLLFPTVWEEPFGLVMIEAMACGTPVVALKNGSVPEVLKGFPNLICSTVEEMIRKVRRGRYPAPKVLRQYVLNRFTTKKMVDRYLRIYETIRNHVKEMR